MVANTPNGRIPHIGGGIALLPLGPNGEKNGVDDLLAQGLTWGDIQSYIYPMNDVFDAKAGNFSPAKGLLSSLTDPVSGNDDNQIASLLPAQSVADFLEEAPVSYDWVIEGLFAKGAITKLAGKAKESGKTTFLMCGVSEILVGAPFLGRKTQTARVTYLSEQASNLREALKDAGLDDPEVEGLSLVSAYKVAHMNWPELTKVVEAYSSVNKVDLLVIDTLVDFSDVEDEAENSSGKVKSTIKPLKHLAQSMNMAVVFTQHHNLEGRGRGSTQFEGDPDILVDLYATDQINGDVESNVRLLKAIGRGVNFHQFVKFTKDNGYEGLNTSEEDLIAVGRGGKVILKFLPVLRADALTVIKIKSSLENAGKEMSDSTIRRHLKELVKAELALEDGDGSKGSPHVYWRAEPKTSDTEDEEKGDVTTDTNLSSPSPETGSDDDDNKNPADNVTPMRPGIEVSEGPPAPAPKKEKKKTKEVVELPSPKELAEAFDSYVHTEERLAECHQWALEQLYMSIDIETKGKNKDTMDEATLFTKAVVRGIGLCSEGKGWFLDCDHLEDKRVADLLRNLEDRPVYFHNSAFDVPRIHRRFGVLLNKNVRDTLIATRTARAGEWESIPTVTENGKTMTKRPKKEYDLESCIERELGIEIPKVKQKWSGPLTEARMEYVLDDVTYLKDLYQKLIERMEDVGVKTAYDGIAATVHMFLESAAYGVPFDIQMLEGLQAEIKKEMDRAEDQLKKLSKKHAPHPEGLHWVWRNSIKDTSPEGMGRAGMHRMLQMVGVKLPKLELEPTLLDNRDKHPLVKALYDYRKAAAVYSKYRRIPEDFYEDGHLHPQVKIAGAVTGRVLYGDPNIQGFDKKKTEAYRRCIRAKEGFSIVKGDFAQQELRIAAWWSEDPALMATFANNEDVYMKVAEKIVGKKVKRGTKIGDNARAAAKRAVLGYLYGLGPEMYREYVYKDTGEDISEEIAKRDRSAFRRAYPDFYKWQKEYGKHKDETNLPKEGMWETRSVRGWRRVVEGRYERKSEWKQKNNIPADWIPSFTERLNGPIQSTAGDILYLTLIKLDADLGAGLYPGTRFLFTAHDEVVLTCPEGMNREVAAWLKSKMAEAFEEVLGPKLGGSRSVEVGGGPSWGEIEEWV